MNLKRSTLALLLLFFVATSAIAQPSVYFGNELFKELKFKRAISYYLTAVKSKPKLTTIERLADCYRLTNDYAAAAKWYERAAAFPNCRSIDYYYWGMMLKTIKQYDLAKEKFGYWGARDLAHIALADKMQMSCDSAKNWVNNPKKVFVHPEYGLNSEYTDFGAVAFKTGVVFTSNRPVKNLKNDTRYSRLLGRPFYKLFYADTITNDTSRYLVLPLAKELNKKYNDGPCSFSPSYDTIWFTRTNVEKGFNTRSKVNNLQLFYSLADETGWFISLPFKYNNKAYSYAHPCIAKNGKKLFFSSDMPGGFGGMDIYSCSMTDTGWSRPVNLGAAINSNEDDMFPFYDEVRNVLYYSSAGHSSIGGLDIFKSALLNNRWTTPQNLMPPYNSSKDDFSFFLNKDGKTGYLSTNRATEPGNDEIYSFSYSNNNGGFYNQQNITLGITPAFIDFGRELPITDANVSLTSLSTGTELKRLNVPGDLSYAINSNELYKLEIIKEGFFKYSKTFTTADLANLTEVNNLGKGILTWKPIMRKLVLNECIVLQNIYYDYNSADLRKDSYKELDKVATLLVENPSLKLQLGSHTDSRGDDDYNMTLSRNRAQNAVRYIIGLGISSDRIIAKGYGETEPLNKCIDGIPCTDGEYQLNRRTDFRIIGLIPNKTIINTSAQ